ncbi:MAG TPA: hypothetical protein VJT08_04375 [Terriglobales bacterium]|nr:hypothetical protein [Terriglobales bacterium]
MAQSFIAATVPAKIDRVSGTTHSGLVEAPALPSSTGRSIRGSQGGGRVRARPKNFWRRDAA